MRPVRIQFLALSVLLLSAACGASGGSEPAAETSPERSGQAAETAPAPGREPMSAPASAPASKTPGTSACGNAQLALALAGGQGGAGTHIQRLEIVNNGATCTLEGRPDVYPYDAKGARMKGFKTGPVPADFGAIGGNPGPITLEKGGKAVFYLVVNDNSSDGRTCPDAAGLAFLAPGGGQGAAPARLSWKWSPCPGEIQVSAIQPPSSNF